MLRITYTYLTILGFIFIFSSCSKYEEYEFYDYDNPPGETRTFTDNRDGQTYEYVQIGDQYWMAENLNYYTSNYNNNSDNAATYGRLYDWETACEVCPDGWHLPSDAEWTELTDYLGGAEIAGGKMKTTGTAYWESPNEGATNESGFSALPGGYRGSNGSFYYMGYYALFWSSTESGSNCAWYRSLGCNYTGVYRYSSYKDYGFSVRCVRDN